MLHRTATGVLILILLLSAKAVSALSVDPQLIQLVSPQSRLIAGMSSTAAQGSTGSFLLITAENRTDLSDFFSLTGGDATRRMSSLLFVTGADRGTDAKEHSLLVSGEFNRDSIFRFSAAGMSRESYRGISALAVPPFKRERETLREVRWLAILDARIALFGSVASVQHELDRWIERTAADMLLTERLQRLARHDDSWCVLLARDREGLTERVLAKLDPRLGEVAHQGGLLAFGIKFGRKIEIAVDSDPFPTENVSTRRDLTEGASGGALHFFSSSPSDNAGSQAVVKVSRRKYQDWSDASISDDGLFAKR